MNLVPSQYREVGVADVPVALDAASLRRRLLGRQAYRRTRYLIARAGGRAAVVEVATRSRGPLFSPITEVTMLAGPEETAEVDSPETDTAVPTQLARAAAAGAPGARCAVVRGRYGHVSFIIDPAPVRITVVEVVPPHPPKLVDQLSRALESAEDLPPVELAPELVDLADLAATSPAGHYLFPCRAGEAQASLPGGAAVSYLDEIPERAPWTLVGCARSRAIHEWFYGDEPPAVDMCPRNLAARRPDRGGVVLTKCCLLEDRVGAEDGMVVVPWGATAAQIRTGLEMAVAQAQGVAPDSPADGPVPQSPAGGPAPDSSAPESPAAGSAPDAPAVGSAPP